MNSVAEEKNRRILVIDDNDAIHDDFRKVLNASTGSSLQEAEAILFGDEPRSAGPKFNLEFAHQGGQLAIGDGILDADPRIGAVRNVASWTG